jgi:hypothetical protein
LSEKIHQNANSTEDDIMSVQYRSSILRFEMRKVRVTGSNGSGVIPAARNHIRGYNVVVDDDDNDVVAVERISSEPGMLNYMKCISMIL